MEYAARSDGMPMKASTSYADYYTVLFILMRHINLFSLCPYKIIVDVNLSKINIGVERAKHLLQKSVISYHFGKCQHMQIGFFVM